MSDLSPLEIDRVDIERELCRRSLSHFVRSGWHVLEPGTELKWGWALDLMCRHLEAVTRGEMLEMTGHNNVLFNVPPGMMKSLLVNVFWPSWEWGPASLPHHRFLGTAHKQDLAVRDAVNMRRLVSSEWYQTRWPLPLSQDINSKLKFANEFTGFREAMAFTSMTGSRGDRVNLDDPLSVNDAMSDTALAEARFTFLESLPTRVNNDASAVVVIMQRLHESDPSGIILDMDLPYVHVMLPMYFEPDRRCVTPWGEDPRQFEGELLFPERFPPKKVRELEISLGQYGTAGQLQQRPAPRGGGMFKREWLEIVDAPPSGRVRRARGWDLAASEDPTAARTAGCRMSMDTDRIFYIEDMAKGQVRESAVEKFIISTARIDGKRVVGSIPQDPGSSGKFQASYLVRQLAGFPYTASTESGDKVTRAQPLAAQMEMGNVRLVRGPWNESFLQEMETFPAGKFKDQVDAASRAFSTLVDRPWYEINV